MRGLVALSCIAVLGFVAGLAVADDVPKSQRVVSASAEGTQDKSPVFLLRYRFRAGDKLRYVVTQKAKFETQVGSSKGVDRNSSTTHKHLKVVSVDKNGQAWLEPMIDSVKISRQKGEHKPKSFDSTTGEKPHPIFAGVAEAIGKPLARMRVSTTGKLIAAKAVLPKKVQKKVARNNGPPKPANDASKNFLAVFPEKPIRVGETWVDKDFKVQLNVAPKLWREFGILRKYKLESVADGKATISLVMVPMRPVTQPNLQVQLAGRMLSGEIVFDIVRGEIISRTLKVDNTVYGFADRNSKLHVMNERTEKLIRKPAVAKAKSTTTKN